jgi:putative hydrolase of the HAD superfamily
MRGLILDLDDTLLDERKASSIALDAFFDEHDQSWTGESKEAAQQRWRQLSARHWRMFEAGESTFRGQRRARVREFLRLELSNTEADLAFEPYRLAYEAAWTLVPGCEAFLDRTKDVPKVIVTNGDKAQQLKKVQITRLHEHVVEVITPEDCGHWKPRPEIFLAALALLKLEPHECLMIGDDPVRDIQPTVALGMQTFLVVAGNPARSILAALP